VGSPLRKVLQVRHDEASIERFRDRFRNSAADTIDRFLENNSDCLDIGLASIACEVVRCEDASKLTERSNGNWYPLLGEVMYAHPADLRSNKVAFVTFNYDRSLEHFLFTSIKNLYNINDDEAAHVVNFFQIFHMYGKVGNLPWGKPNANEPPSSYFRPYDTVATPEVIEASAKCLRIPHDQTLGKKQHARLSLVLQHYKAIHFLGFGYDALNLTRVVGRGDPSLPMLQGSAYGLGDQTMKRIRAEFNIRLDQKRQSALEYLQNVVGWG